MILGAIEPRWAGARCWRCQDVRRRGSEGGKVAVVTGIVAAMRTFMCKPDFVTETVPTGPVSVLLKVRTRDAVGCSM